MSHGNPLLNPQTGMFKGAASVDLPHILRGIYVELRTQTYLLGEILGQPGVLDALRADPSTVISDSANAEYLERTPYTPDPGDD